MLKAVTETESYTRLSAVIKSQSVVENRFPQSSEISEIIAVYPQVSLVSCEVSSGRVNYSGRLVLSIVYSDEEGKLCRMQKGAEFSHYADDEGLVPAQTGVCTLTCDRTQIRRDGSSYVLSVIVGAEISVYSRAERVYVTDADGGIVKTETRSLYSAVTFSGGSEVEDDFDADSLVDILVPGAHPIILSAECRTGEIAVEGEVYLSLFAMRGDTPVCLDRVIPFKANIPCDDASAGRSAHVNVEIKDLNVTANVNEERGKCEINFVCDLAFAGVFYDEREISVATDAFSAEREVNLSYGEEIVSPVLDIKVYTERVSGQAASKSKLDYTCTLRAAALPNAEYDYVKQSGAVEGSVSAMLIYEQNGEIKSTEINLPFAANLNGVAGDGEKVSVKVAVCGMSVRQRSEGELEAEATLKISACVTKEQKCSYLSDVEEGDLLPVSDSAISVFIPDAGDGIWEISKKLRRPPQEVLERNAELVFPLTGKERIVIYRRKTV